MISLPYTICFCLCRDQVLMIYRNNPPNAGRWNGLGGKIEAGETPLSNIHREILEEAEIDLHQAQKIQFGGLVTWATRISDMQSKRGMYVFLAHLAPDFSIGPDRPTVEGFLSWKTLDWVCDQSNNLVVDNIPHFLPLMLATSKPQEYCCISEAGRGPIMEIYTLPTDLQAINSIL